jgi:hypothetical protein
MLILLILFHPIPFHSKFESSEGRAQKQKRVSANRESPNTFDSWNSQKDMMLTSSSWASFKQKVPSSEYRSIGKAFCFWNQSITDFCFFRGIGRIEWHFAIPISTETFLKDCSSTFQSVDGLFRVFCRKDLVSVQIILILMTTWLESYLLCMPKSLKKRNAKIGLVVKLCLKMQGSVIEIPAIVNVLSIFLSTNSTTWIAQRIFGEWWDVIAFRRQWSAQMMSQHFRSHSDTHRCHDDNR